MHPAMAGVQPETLQRGVEQIDINPKRYTDAG